jgi:hypothetical protein
MEALAIVVGLVVWSLVAAFAGEFYSILLRDLLREGRASY